MSGVWPADVLVLLIVAVVVMTGLAAGRRRGAVIGGVAALAVCWLLVAALAAGGSPEVRRYVDRSVLLPSSLVPGKTLDHGGSPMHQIVERW